MIKSIRQKVREGRVIAGTFLDLGSPITTEIAGQAGFDWLLVDLEHASGDFLELVHQLQAAGGTPAALEFGRFSREFKRINGPCPSKQTFRSHRMEMSTKRLFHYKPEMRAFDW